MRISTLQYFRDGVSNIQNARNSLGLTQQQIATGKSILTPSDDPIRSTQILKVDEELSMNEQFQNNISFAVSKNRMEDSILGSTVDSIQRIRDLTVRANSGALSDDDIRGIGVEVEAIMDQMVSLLNTTDGTGEYIFAGFQGSTKPFVTQAGGGYEYVGDDGYRSVEIAAGDTIEVSDSGKAIFVDVSSANNTILTSKSSNNSADSSANISTGIIVDQEAFDAVYPEDFVVEFNDPLLNQNQRTLTVTQRSDGSPVMGTRPGGYLINVPYQEGQIMEFNGIEFFVAGSPVAGDTFFIESSGTESVLDTVDRLATVLKLEDSNSLILATEVEVIGRATPGRPTTTLAGNYVAAQRITVEDASTVQNVDIAANATAPAIALALDALNGISASALPTVATLDLTLTPLNVGDLIEFELNGTQISAVTGATNAATWANVQTAVTGAVANLTSINTSGVFEFTESLGNNIEIQNFQVVDVPGISMDVSSGIINGDTVSFTITGTDGESVDIVYAAGAGDTNDQLLAEITTDLAADPDGPAFTVSQAVAGGPVELRYTGDTDGSSNFQITTFTDTGGDGQIALTSVTGSSVINTATSVAATSLVNGTDVTVLATDTNSTARFTGFIGDPVTLLEGSGDSSTVAGRLNISAQVGFEISSNVVSGFGGLFTEAAADDEVVNDRFQESISRVLANIDQAMESILITRSGVGARLNTLDSTLDLNEGINIELQTYLSDLEDLDYAEAITTMNMQTLILEASQNSFVKISSLSLLDFI